jgi:hypothetical protein
MVAAVIKLCHVTAIILSKMFMDSLHGKQKKSTVSTTNAPRLRLYKNMQLTVKPR